MKSILSICCLFAISVAFAQDAPMKEIKQLSFMSGKWATKGEWGDMEENWSQPLGNCMMCSYRCVKDGQVVFYEFIVIEQMPAGPVMKLRHFSPGNIGWEEKDKPYEYPLTYLDENVARFDRPDKKTSLTFRRVDQTHLNVILERQDKEGKWVQDEFNYTAVK